MYGVPFVRLLVVYSLDDDALSICGGLLRLGILG